MSQIQEFIDADGDIPAGDKPNFVDPKTTAKTTTDKHMRMVAQPFVFTNYRRYYGEATLPFNKEADAMMETPEKFYNFLKEKKMEDTFEQYFVKDNTIKKQLEERSRKKAIDIIEDILSKRNTSTDVMTREEEITIDEIRGKEELILGKIDKIVEYMKNNFKPNEKKLILSYIKEKING